MRGIENQICSKSRIYRPFALIESRGINLKIRAQVNRYETAVN